MHLLKVATRRIAATSLLLLTTACATPQPTLLVTGEARSAIAMSEVEVYQRAPREFVEVAQLSVSAGAGAAEDSVRLQAAYDELRAQAAQLGANGVLITSIDETETKTVEFSTRDSWIANRGGKNMYAKGEQSNNGVVKAGETQVGALAIRVPARQRQREQRALQSDVYGQGSRMCLAMVEGMKDLKAVPRVHDCPEGYFDTLTGEVR